MNGFYPDFTDTSEKVDNGRRPFPGKGNPRDEEMAALKRGMARVKKKRGFLREAGKFFAKESG